MFPQSWKMSVANLLQGYNGTSWSKDKLGSCLCSECEYFRHNSQFKTGFSNWLLSPGQYTVSLACSLHLLRPKCPSCINLSMASHFLSGMTILVPFKIKPSSIISSSLNVQSHMVVDLEVFVWLSLAILALWYVSTKQVHHLLAWTLSVDLYCHFLQIVGEFFYIHRIWEV